MAKYVVAAIAMLSGAEALTVGYSTPVQPRAVSMMSEQVSASSPMRSMVMPGPGIDALQAEQSPYRAGSCEMRFGPGKCIFRGDKCTGKKCKVNSAPVRLSQKSLANCPSCTKSMVSL